MMIDVFYDGKCGLCSKEITYYRRIAPDAVFNWLDIANDPAPLQQYHILQSDALRQLHVRDAKGDFIERMLLLCTIFNRGYLGCWYCRGAIGADAFIVIWRQLRYWRVLAVLVGLPG